MKKIVLWLYFALILSYASICGLIYLFQEQLIFPATKLAVDFKFNFGDPFKEVTIPVNGAFLNGLIFEPQGESKGVVIYFHGNGGTLDRWGTIEKDYTSRGYTLFIIDYRGYGKSTGRINNEDELFDDAQKVYNFVDAQFPQLPKIIWGRSIGTGIAAQLASRNKAKELILETPYYNLEEIAANKRPYLPVKQLLKYPIYTNEYLPKVNCPIFIIHGTNDPVIPYNSARKLAALVRTTFFTVPGGSHELDGTQEFVQFLDAVLK